MRRYNTSSEKKEPIHFIAISKSMHCVSAFVRARESEHWRGWEDGQKEVKVAGEKVKEVKLGRRGQNAS